MRDTHGRYRVVKAIVDLGPDWAKGCDSCNHGIVSAPEITGAVEFYLERIVQAVDGDITFCQCQAGKMYRISLLNRHQKLIEDAKKDTRMIESARSKTHPDIENARTAMLLHYGKMATVPTMHMEQEHVPA